MVIHNVGTVQSNNSQLTLTAVDKNNNQSVIFNNMAFSALPVNGSVNVTGQWDLTGVEGAVTLYAKVDPANNTFESNENNNVASKEIVVIGESGIATSIELDATNYKSGQSVTINSKILNGGDIFNGHVEIKIEDSSGYLVTEIVGTTINNLIYAEELKLTNIWNSEDIFAGIYYVVIDVFDNSNTLLISKKEKFTIQSEYQLVSSISTDQQSYIGSSNVHIDAEVLYVAGNQILSNVVAKIEVLDSTNNVIADFTENFDELTPFSKNGISFDWHTANHSISNYQVRIRVYQGLDDIIISETINQFEIISSSFNVVGKLEIASSIIGVGKPLSVSYKLSNESNVELSALSYSLSLVDVTGKEIYQNYIGNIDLAVQGIYLGSKDFVTSNLVLGDYQIRLQVEELINDNLVVHNVLDSTIVKLVDRQGPVITLTTPSNSEIINSKNRYIEVDITDKLSEIVRVEIRFNGGDWSRMIVDNNLTNRFKTSIDSFNDGAYSFDIKAYDAESNKSEISSISLNVDNQKPTINFSQIVNGNTYNSSVRPLITIEDLNLTQTNIKLNGVDFLSGSLVNNDGEYQLIASGLDAAGNVSQQKIQFVIDSIAPEILVSGVTNQLITNQTVIPIIIINDSQLAEQSILLNSVDYESASAITSEGSYQLVVTAKDNAGNVSNQTFNFVIDKTAPSISITGITNGMFSSLDLTPVIIINDEHLLSQSIVLNGANYISGTLLTEDGQYHIIASATDSAGNQTTSTIEFSIDKTPPEIVITGINELQHYADNVTAIIEINEDNLLTQSIKLNGQDYISGTLISAEGDYELIVVVEDFVGNNTEKHFLFVIDKTLPIISVSGVLDGAVYNDSVTPIIEVTDSYLDKYNLTLNNNTYIIGSLIKDSDSYQLIITASDKAKNTVEMTIHFDIQSLPPELTIITPQTGSIISESNVDIVGKSSPGATVILVDENGTEFSTISDQIGDFRFIQFGLVEGVNLLSLQAVDQWGQSSASITIAINSQSTQLEGEVVISNGVLVLLPRHGSEELVSLIQESLVSENVELLFVHSEYEMIKNLRSQRFTRIILANINNSLGRYDKHRHCPHFYHNLNISNTTASEVRAMVAKGLGVLLIQNNPQFNHFMKDVFSAKTHGIINNQDYIRVLGDSDFEGRTVEFINSSVSYEVINAQVIVESSLGLPLVTSNIYYQGKALLAGFNPFKIESRDNAKQFIKELIDYLEPKNSTYFAGSPVRINWKAKSLVYPANVNFHLTVPEKMNLILATYGVVVDVNHAAWSKSLTTDNIIFSALGNLPENAGDYTINGKLDSYSTNGEFLSSISDNLFFTVSQGHNDIRQRLQDAIQVIEIETCNDGSYQNYGYLMHGAYRCRIYIKLINYLISSAYKMDINTTFKARIAIYKLLNAYSIINLYAKDKNLLPLIGNVINEFQLKWVALKQSKNTYFRHNSIKSFSEDADSISLKYILENGFKNSIVNGEFIEEKSGIE